MEFPRERRTQRLRLRALAWDDAEVFREIHLDPRTHVHTPAGPPDADQVAGMFAGIVGVWEDQGSSYWAVELDENVIGVCGVEAQPILERECWNLYYRLSPETWGRGFASEAAREAVVVAGLVAPNRPVVARTRSSNLPSMRVAERAGLVRRAALDHDGFVVLATEW
jgi:RimJ/RimL family protein N-acetyltransferase